MADINPLRSPYSNEMRRLVIRGSTELNQSNSFIANLFKISTRTVQSLHCSIYMNVDLSFACTDSSPS